MSVAIIRSAVVLVLLVCGCTMLHAQAPSTADVLQAHIRAWAEARIPMLGSNVTIDVAAHPDKTWFEAAMITALRDRGVDAIRGYEGPRLRIVPVDVSTRYDRTDHPDSVVRIVTARLYEERIDADGRAVPLRTADTLSLQRTDILGRDQVNALQSKQYPAMHGDVPPPPRDIWDDILEPVVYVAAAAVTVVLLFTVRSK